jgi:hypothetical protein
LSDNDDQSNHEDAGKFALNEKGQLGIVIDVVSLTGSKVVYLGVMVDSDGTWASLKPRIMSKKLRSDCLLEAVMNLEPPSKVLPKVSTKVLYVNPPSAGSPPSKGPADFLENLLSGFKDIGSPPMKAPDPNDFTVDNDDDGPHNEDDGA